MKDMTEVKDFYVAIFSLGGNFEEPTFGVKIKFRAFLSNASFERKNAFRLI